MYADSILKPSDGYLQMPFEMTEADSIPQLPYVLPQNVILDGWGS